MNIAIVEDEKSTVEKLQEYMQQFSQEEQVECQVFAYFDAESFLLQSKKQNLDVVLMDIELPGMDGMTAVKKLRESGNQVLVIFVTNLAQYAVNGYSVNAFDFLVKPVTYASFYLKLKRAYTGILSQKEKSIVVSSHAGTKVIHTGDLKYVEVNKHVVIYHLVEENYVTSGTLKNVREVLEGLPFAMCNQCYLVNLSYVRGIIRNDVDLGGELLQISAPKRKEFKEALVKYLASSSRRRI